VEIVAHRLERDAHLLELADIEHHFDGNQPGGDVRHADDVLFVAVEGVRLLAGKARIELGPGRAQPVDFQGDETHGCFTPSEYWDILGYEYKRPRPAGEAAIVRRFYRGSARPSPMSMSRRSLLLAAATGMAGVTGARAESPMLTGDGLYRESWFLESFLDLADDLQSTSKAGKRFAIM